MREPWQEYDIVIIGGGPAGLAAGLYAARARRKTILIEKNVTGGQIALTGVDRELPRHSRTGQRLRPRPDDAAAGREVRHGDGLHDGRPASSRRTAGTCVKTDEGDYLAKAVIITAGADYNRLGVPGEERLTGQGVSYCATCDAAFFKDKEVAVVGGGDAAMDEGLFVTRYASKVHVIHRRDELRASAILQERAFANPKMEFVWNTVVTEIVGEEAVRR